MKQIFYGPTGFGKSHLILHGLHSNQKLVIITTNGLKREFENIGLNDVPVTPVSISVVDEQSNDSPKIVIDNPNKFGEVLDGILGFDISSISEMYREDAINAIVEWLEEVGISNDAKCTVVLISIPALINDISFVKRIEKWDADIVVEYTCSKFSVEQGGELEYILKSKDWFAVPIFCKVNYPSPKGDGLITA